MSSSFATVNSVPGISAHRLKWAYEGVRTVIGLVLLAAALLKAHQLIAQPLIENRNWLWTEVGMEWLLSLWLLSLWLLSNWRKNLARWVGIICFAVFAVVAAKLIVQGASSCGCFGSLKAPPAFTLGFDMAATLALAGFKPVTASTSRSASRLGTAVFTVISLIGGAMVLRAQPVSLQAETTIIANEKRIILEPSQ